MGAGYLYNTMIGIREPRAPPLKKIDHDQRSFIQPISKRTLRSSAGLNKAIKERETNRKHEPLRIHHQKRPRTLQNSNKGLGEAHADPSPEHRIGGELERRRSAEPGTAQHITSPIWQQGGPRGAAG